MHIYLEAWSSTSVGPLPGNWLAAHIADLTPDLQVLLSWESHVMSFHSWQFFSASFFHVTELSETQNYAYWYARFFPGTHVFR